MSRKPAGGRSTTMTGTPSQWPGDLLDVTIRESCAEDRRALVRLAGRDSKRPSEDRLLVVEVGGELIAGVPLEGGEPFADPFRRTASLVALLEFRAAQLRRAERRGGRLAMLPRRAWAGRAARRAATA
jgi:hypothetical protein